MPIPRNPRVQMATGHDILVMFEKRIFTSIVMIPRGNRVTGLNWLDVYSTLIVARLLRWLVPLSRWLVPWPRWLVQPIKKHQEFTIFIIILNFFLFFLFLKETLLYFLFVQIWCLHTREVLILFLFFILFLGVSTVVVHDWRIKAMSSGHLYTIHWKPLMTR